MKIFGRIFGLLLSIAALLGIVICIAGVVLVRDAVAQGRESAENTLSGLIGALDSAEVTMNTIRDTIVAVGDGLNTVQNSSANVATAIRSTDPVFDEITVAFDDTMPATIETVQAALPNLIQVAETVDQTMQILSNFDLNETLGGGTIKIPDVRVLGQRISMPELQLPGFDFNFDLGVDYDPNNAFDESLVGVEQNLEGIPESMRTLASSLTVTQDSILVLADDVDAIGTDLTNINEQVDQLPEQIDSYNASLAEVKTNLEQVEQQLARQMDQAALYLSIALGWFAVMQLAPLYLGLELLFNRRSRS